MPLRLSPDQLAGEQPSASQRWAGAAHLGRRHDPSHSQECEKSFLSISEEVVEKKMNGLASPGTSLAPSSADLEREEAPEQPFLLYLSADLHVHYVALDYTSFDSKFVPKSW